jgi:hypothetical protein
LHWDRYTNYPASTIIAQGKNPADLLGDMNAYRLVLKKMGGDSLMLTMGGPGESDPDQSKDWHVGFIYRTGGGRQVQDAFSTPSIITYGPYRVCQINYFFIDTQAAVNALKSRYNNTANKDVIGVVTHTFNFAADSNYVIDWMRFAQSTQRKTVRQILRDRKCNPTATAVEELESIPREFRLAQNYPNPFNPSTVISFQLSVNSRVTLKVFDVNGSEAATLVEGEMAAGNHAVTFAPREATTGLYFYKLTAGKFSQTRKAVLMK